jgi:repressor LexA
LRRDWNQKRGIEVVVRGDGDGDGAPGELALPFFGRIAAGRPIEALSGDETLGVPHHLLAGRRVAPADHYVLEVVGESMIDEGIHEGDLVVVQRREVARAGEMVVALVGNEATLKRFFPEGARIRLQPANPNMEPLFVAAADVQVQGIVVGLMRKF